MAHRLSKTEPARTKKGHLMINQNHTENTAKDYVPLTKKPASYHASDEQILWFADLLSRQQNNLRFSRDSYISKFSASSSLPEDFAQRVELFSSLEASIKELQIFARAERKKLKDAAKAKAKEVMQ